MDEKGIEKLTTDFFDSNEMQVCYFVDSKISGSRIEVFIEKDGGINYAECQQLSRHLEAIFDEKKYFGEKYTLEVSSPGVGSPLKKLRQYQNNIGRTIEVKYEDTKLRGKLKQVDSDGIVIETEETIKEGKKKIKNIVDTTILFDQIKEAKIKVSFS